VNRLIRFAFQQFYTTFAWSYDAIATLVSFGEWKAWGRVALAFVLEGARVLEIAHGPGHLHLTLRQRGMAVFGIDRSWQMARMLQTKTRRAAHQAQANAQHLPFVNGAFDCVLSTFPAEFIFADKTLREIHRTLKPDSSVVIVPSTSFRGNAWVIRLVQFAYRVTGQRAMDVAPVRAKFESHGFAFAQHIIQTRHANVIVWVCTKRRA
jgi:ubiquinone/menaquinone biosynthesis C-methylase UbiE